MSKYINFRNFGIASFIAVIVCILCSFSYSIDGAKVDVREVSISGHKYIVAASGYYGASLRPGGVSIIHSAGCSCNK